MEAKAEEQRKAKAASEAAWRKAQRKREMQRVEVIHAMWSITAAALAD